MNSHQYIDNPQNMNSRTTRHFILVFFLFIVTAASTEAQFTRIGGGLTFSPGIDNFTYKTGNPGFNARGVFDLADRFPDNPELESSYEVLAGLNIGTGIEMIVGDDSDAFTQIKYAVGKYQHLVISIGVHYYLSGRRFKSW
jgi:hypothetical protein